jgi:hypothetical protein
MSGQGALDAFRVMRDHDQISAGRLVWLAAALFPIVQRPDRDVVSRREFFLCQIKRSTQCFGARDAASSAKLHRCHGLRVRIAKRRGRNLFVGFSPKPDPIHFPLNGFHGRASRCIVYGQPVACPDGIKAQARADTYPTRGQHALSGICRSRCCGEIVTLIMFGTAVAATYSWLYRHSAKRWLLWCDSAAACRSS